MQNLNTLGILPPQFINKKLFAYTRKFRCATASSDENTLEVSYLTNSAGKSHMLYNLLMRKVMLEMGWYEPASRSEYSRVQDSDYVKRLILVAGQPTGRERTLDSS